MEYLSNDLLMDSYEEALKQNLDQDFILLFETELVKRNLKLDIQNS